MELAPDGVVGVVGLPEDNILAPIPELALELGEKM
jgi:hypothetical protein